MKTPQPSMTVSHPAARTGSALIVTLLLLALISIIIVGILSSVTWERSTARSGYEMNKARAMADAGMHVAVAQLRLALDSWDSPYQNFSNVPPTYYWSVSPGILTRWSYSGVAPLTNYPLFSLATNGTTNLVNLNTPTANGIYPIIGGVSPPAVPVYWVNVLRNPANATASSTNAIVGRYAFWMDDENAKININTADGSLKYTTNSVGLGTPSEVSLQVLQQGGAPLATSTLTNIVYLARTQGFNSAREILRAPGVSNDLYTNNTFNLTTYGRSPEINVFGEPKINLIPASLAAGVNLGPPGNLQINDITLRPLTEIYPTPYQLPPYLATNLSGPSLGSESNPMRPQVFSQEWPIFGPGAGAFYLNGQEYGSDRQGFMSDMLARYLGGTNGMNMPIRWPVFPYPSTPLASAAGSGTTGFIGKYSLRQLDALAEQITDVAGKAITPEAINQLGENFSDLGYPLSVTTSHGGFLSHQLVPGLGRSPRINEILIDVTTTGGVISGSPPSITTPPSMTVAIYLETYLPAGFGGVDLLNINNGLPPAGEMQGDSVQLGGQENGYWELGGAWDVYFGCLNLEDLPTVDSTQNYPRPVTAPEYAAIFRVAPQPYAGAQTNDYWGDTLLQNNAGIDFTGSDPTAADPDQVRATAYHQGFPTNSAGQYLGTGPNPNNPAPLLRMGYLSDAVYGSKPGLVPWYAGQYRTVNNYSSSTPYPMMTNAAAALTNVIFSGGLIIDGSTWGGYNDPVMTPFESSVRGHPVTPSQYGNSWDFETVNNSALAWNNPGLLPASPGNPNQTTDAQNPTELLRDRVMKGVIPVNFSALIPSPSTSALGPVDQTWYHVEVADPLVNQFAGDWITNGTSDNTMGVGNGSPPAISSPFGGFATYYNGQNFSATHATANSPYFDPDSFWMPALDPKIPRSARMPNVGYLNYQRTGVIPDDETVAVNLQHGTPYRCLNFNAVNDASQMGAVTSYRASGYYYPDWALLDLFTVPSTLLPYHGPYGYYETNGTWKPGSILTGNPTNLYIFGTWGSSTPGRINPNGSVIYTTNVNIPTSDANGQMITRTLPLQAVLYGIKVNQTIATGTSAATATTNAPTFTGGTTLDATGSANIAAAIANYIGTYGPLREPAEICNIPAISTNFPNDAAHYNPTRNDLIRQIVGNLTTQSDTFSVWVAGQSISKLKINTNYGQYEAGDQILASVRCHFIVERYLDPGADGVIGNSALPTGSPPTGDVDRIVGTYDDPANANYHPANPRYLYRVVYAEEIGN